MRGANPEEKAGAGEPLLGALADEGAAGVPEAVDVADAVAVSDAAAVPVAVDVADAVAVSDAAAVPVALELVGRHAPSVRRWVEGMLGWQPVDDDPAGPVPPAVRLVDHHPVVARTGGTSVLPTLMVVDDDASASATATLVHAAQPDAVLSWPSGRDDLPDVVGTLLRRPRRGGGEPRLLRVGGAAGGVGTTTVALALAGLLGWRGDGALALVRPPAAVPDLRVVPAEAVGAPDLWARADALPAVPRGRVLGIVGGDAPLPVDPRIAAAVVDAGVDDDVDVLVCRPDAAGLARLATTTAAAVVLVGLGPALPKDLERAARGRAGVTVPWSARVARAGLHGRVPGSLPGRWLRRLAPLVERSVDGP